MNRRIRTTWICLAVVSAMLAGSCAGGDDPSSDGADASLDDGSQVAIDYDAIGLWSDGQCDEARDPLVIGLMTVFESPALSLKDQASALEASADAFNARGGANGACIEVHACDDEANLDRSLECVREIDEAGVVATVNDQGTAGQDEVSTAMAEAGIPRIASNVTPADWTDPNAYPLDSSGTGQALMQPKSLIEVGVKEMGIVRVDLPAAAALEGLLTDIYSDEGVTFPFVTPVPVGTTDYSQFILRAHDEDVGGVLLGTGEQDAIQIAKAAQQLDTDLLLGAGLGSFSYGAVADLGDFADHMSFVSPFPPPTVDLPAYQALRDDLAATGEDALQPENLKASPMRSWIGLYGLLRMIRDAGMTEFSREGVREMLGAATDVPMLDIFGTENWTPNLDHPGLFRRAGMNHYAVYRFDPDASAPGDLHGNFVEVAQFNFDDVLCGSPMGGPEPC